MSRYFHPHLNPLPSRERKEEMHSLCSWELVRSYSFILSPLMEDGWAGIQRGFTPAGIWGREIVRVRGRKIKRPQAKNQKYKSKITNVAMRF
jgi:hypothetical protein